MVKIVNPCMCKVFCNMKANAFARIEYKDGCLSIRGVIGPMKNGNCKAAGQCVDEMRNGIPVDVWTKEMLQKFCDIWDKWHLNDLRPYCEHQKQLGWDELARKEVVLYHYRLNNDALQKQKAAESAALSALRNGIPFYPSKEQAIYAALPHSITVPEKISGTKELYYEPKKKLFDGDTGFEERKTLGWLDETKHPDGILSRACPICGYKYGTSWKKENVPHDVIEWLFDLPDSKIEPAWV